MFNREDYILTINEHGNEVLVHKKWFHKPQVVATAEYAVETTTEEVSQIAELEVIGEAPAPPRAMQHCFPKTKAGLQLANAVEKASLGLITHEEADVKLRKGEVVKVIDAAKKLGLKGNESVVRALAMGWIKAYFLREVTSFVHAYIDVRSMLEYKKSDMHRVALARSASHTIKENKDVAIPHEPAAVAVASTEPTPPKARRPGTNGTPMRLNSLQQLESYKGNFK